VVRSGESSGSLPWLSLAIIALGSLIAGCGTFEQARHTSPSDGIGGKSASVTERSGGLTVMLVAAPTRAKANSTVRFDVTASERRAHGAFGYQLRYGDGITAENAPVPLVCLAGKGATAMRRTWRLYHRYRSPGSYTASLTVYVNCTRDHATATVAVSIA